ncbi:MAG: L-serine ammonia-lyase, iron-sulfur-dependent, subunit alpha [Chloroflexota bacterium]|nr:L-serine ammonia-lyase, iron-sulfur-dependent, subunit alpha [Chloroflexota bacterium]
MKPISILNDVLGPIMRGPSSSHTAGPFYIGALARALLGDEPAAATFAFDPGGSLAEVYGQQGSDLGFAAGVIGWAITDERFPHVLDLAAGRGLEIAFVIERLPRADHPNTVEIRMASRGGRRLRAVAKSTGGGAVVFTEVAGWPVHLTGDAHEALVEMEENVEPTVDQLLTQDGESMGQPARQTRPNRVLLRVRRRAPLGAGVEARLESLPGVRNVWTSPPVSFVQRGAPIFSCAAEMVALAEERACSLGQIALAYEATLLGISKSDVLDEMVRRFDVMQAAVQRGLEEDLPPMQLLRPSARRVYRAEAEGRTAIGGIHTRAAARAMAVMHVNGGMGVVCAAPTAGAAGVIPGVATTLTEEKGLSREQAALALLAASAVGLVTATRATFAAEVAGCQVEISAAGAMAAAGVVEAAGGSPRQASDAAAIYFQNTMGLICDLVQGIVEVPCHTRNAVAASGAFVCADLILGGYVNPIPLDETVDAVYRVGQMLPRELKCTALGGLALAPSALAMPRLR